tara:strand:- start:8639 stop:9814 length:1176 start_codon:yes stop_codon:yes gene_type:complete
MELKGKKIIDKYLGFFLIIVLTPLSLLLGLILRRNHDIKVINKSITIIKILGGGSLFTSLPMLLQLKKKYERAQIVLVTSDSTLAFAQMMGIFDKIIIIKSNNLFELIISSIKAVYQSLFTDVTIDLEVHSKLSSIFSLMTCAKNRIGFYSKRNKWKYGILTHKIPYSDEELLKSFYKMAFEIAGVKEIEQSTYLNHLINHNNLIPYKKNNVIRKLSIGPYCSDLCSEREFSDNEWILNLKKLNLKYLEEIVIVGSINDKMKSIGLVNKIKDWKYNLRIKNKVGVLSLKDSVQEILHTDIFLTIDSGLNHILRELNMKILSYWGPSDPATRLDLKKKSNEIVIYKKIACSPCVHYTDYAPCFGDNICMKQHNFKISSSQAEYYNKFINRGE